MQANGLNWLRRPGEKETARTVSALFLFILLFSCAPKESVKTISYPLPDVVTASYLIGHITFDDIHTLSGSAGIRIFKDEEFAAHLTGAVNYRKPDSLSVSLFGPFGVTVMKILIRESSLELYIPNKDILYTTNFKIPFIMPDSEILANHTVQLSENTEGYVLDFFASSEWEQKLTARYYFDRETLLNTKIEKYNGSKLLFQILIDEATEDNIPKDFTVIAGSNRFVISTKNLAVNSDIPEQAFADIQASRTLPLQDFLRTLEPNQ